MILTSQIKKAGTSYLAGFGRLEGRLEGAKWEGQQYGHNDELAGSISELAGESLILCRPCSNVLNKTDWKERILVHETCRRFPFWFFILLQSKGVIFQRFS